MDLKGTNNEKVPFEKCRGLRDRINDYAEEHDFVVSEFVEKKIKWSETHGGRCFCSPFERLTCPCDNVYEDMKLYNGRCLCRMFWKPEAYSKWLKTKEKQKPLTTYQKETMNDFEKAEAKKQIKDMWKKLEK